MRGCAQIEQGLLPMLPGDKGVAAADGDVGDEGSDAEFEASERVEMGVMGLAAFVA